MPPTTASKKKKSNNNNNNNARGASAAAISTDFTFVLGLIIEHYSNHMITKYADIKLRVKLMLVSKSIRKATANSDLVWFSCGAAWEDAHIAKTTAYCRASKAPTTIVNGIINRPYPDIDPRVDPAGILQVSRKGKNNVVVAKRWNGYGKVFSEEERQLKQKDPVRYAALGFDYSKEDYAKMVAHFKKCITLTFSRTCGVCFKGASGTVPSWALGRRVCPNCMRENMVSNVVLFHENNIVMDDMFPLIKGKVWYFESRHNDCNALCAVTWNPLDFDNDSRMAGTAHTVAKKYLGRIYFLWKPHLCNIIDLNTGTILLGSEEEDTAHFNDTAKQSFVVPPDADRRRAARTLSAYARSMMVRLRCALSPLCVHNILHEDSVVDQSQTVRLSLTQSLLASEVERMLIVTEKKFCIRTMSRIARNRSTIITSDCHKDDKEAVLSILKKFEVSRSLRIAVPYTFSVFRTVKDPKNDEILHHANYIESADPPQPLLPFVKRANYWD